MFYEKFGELKNLQVRLLAFVHAAGLIEEPNKFASFPPEGKVKATARGEQPGPHRSPACLCLKRP